MSATLTPGSTIRARAQVDELTEQLMLTTSEGSPLAQIKPDLHSACVRRNGPTVFVCMDTAAQQISRPALTGDGQAWAISQQVTAGARAPTGWHPRANPCMPQADLESHAEVLRCDFAELFELRWAFHRDSRVVDQHLRQKGRVWVQRREDGERVVHKLENRRCAVRGLAWLLRNRRQTPSGKHGPVH
jgi:hypothetical protein